MGGAGVGTLDDAAAVAEFLSSNDASEDVRLVGLSATCPNANDVGAFLRCESRDIFVFSSAFRPVPLEQVYVGVADKSSRKQGDIMDQTVMEVVLQRAQQCQVIVFTHGRSDTVRTAKMIVEAVVATGQISALLPANTPHVAAALSAAEKSLAQGSCLRPLLPYGVGVHHAGLTTHERRTSEDLFREGVLRVLISTATLAWGVNLPAHTVIIKGTEVYSPEKGGFIPLGPMDILQMFGRAGRPQYDDSGEGILITSQSMLPHYIRVCNMLVHVESRLLNSLPERINAEIHSGAIGTVRDAAAWLQHTFLAVRTASNPVDYGVAASGSGGKVTQSDLDEHWHIVAASALQDLCEGGLITFDTKGDGVACTPLGGMAASYYLNAKTVKAFTSSLRASSSDVEVLRTFASADEFAGLSVRKNEVAEVERLSYLVPIPVRDKPTAAAAKAAVLLQCVVSGLPLSGLTMASDALYVAASAGRLLRALADLALRSGWSRPYAAAMLLARASEHRCWPTMCPLRQFPRLTSVAATLERKLGAEALEWSQFQHLSEAEVGGLIGSMRTAPQVVSAFAALPRTSVASTVRAVSATMLEVTTRVRGHFVWDHDVHGRSLPITVTVTDAVGLVISSWCRGALLPIHCAAADDDEVEHLEATHTIPIAAGRPPTSLQLSVFHERWFGCDASSALLCRTVLVPPPVALPVDLTPPTVELATQLESVATACAASGDGNGPLLVEGVRAATQAVGFVALSALQDRVLTPLLLSRGSSVVSAPGGSGRSTCMLFPLLRHLLVNDSPDAPPAPSAAVALQRRREALKRRCVVVVSGSAVEGIAEWLQTTLSAAVGGVIVKQLHDDVTIDLQQLSGADIVVGSADAVASLTRKWRSSPDLQTVGTVVVDDAHLLTPRLEEAISRLRLASATLAAGPDPDADEEDRDEDLPSVAHPPIRFVALMDTSPCAADVAAWVGAGASVILQGPSEGAPAPSLRVVAVDVPHPSGPSDDLMLTRAARALCSALDVASATALDGVAEQAAEAAQCEVNEVDVATEISALTGEELETLQPPRVMLFTDTVATAVSAACLLAAIPLGGSTVSPTVKSQGDVLRSKRGVSSDVEGGDGVASRSARVPSRFATSGDFIADEALRDCSPIVRALAERGVALYIPSAPAAERDAMRSLWVEHKAQVMVSAVPGSWDIPASARADLVVVVTRAATATRHPASDEWADIRRALSRAVDVGAVVESGGSDASAVILCPTTEASALALRLGAVPVSDDGVVDVSGVMGLSVPSDTASSLPFHEQIARGVRNPLAALGVQTMAVGPAFVESLFEVVAESVVTAEAHAGNIASMQDAVDFSTWTFAYRRVATNPSHYRVPGLLTLTARVAAPAQTAVSEMVSELIEDAVAAAEDDGLLRTTPPSQVSDGDGTDSIEITTAGAIASRHCLASTTGAALWKGVPRAKDVVGVLELIAAAEECHVTTHTSGKDAAMLAALWAAVPHPPAVDGVAVESPPGWGDGSYRSIPVLDAAVSSHPNVRTTMSTPSYRAFVLLQAHLCRYILPPLYQHELFTLILPAVPRLVAAIIDTALARGNPTLVAAAVAAAQHLFQGVCPGGSPLLQLPHFDGKMVARAVSAGVPTPSAFADADDAAVATALAPLSTPQKAAVVEFINALPLLSLQLVMGRGATAAAAAGAFAASSPNHDTVVKVPAEKGGRVALSVSDKRRALSVKVTVDPDYGFDDEDATPPAIVRCANAPPRVGAWWAIWRTDPTGPRHVILAARRFLLPRKSDVTLSVNKNVISTILPEGVGSMNTEVLVASEYLIGVNAKKTFTIDLNE